MSEDLILREDAPPGGPKQSVAIDIRNCVLADTDGLVAADPCDAWVLRFEADYAAHLAVNQAAVAYVQSIRDKHEAQAQADYDRCMGIPETPEPPQPAVHLSLSTKGVSSGGSAGGSDGPRSAQIVNFGVDPATGGGGCSSIPRTVFCEPSLHMKTNPLDKIKIDTGFSQVVPIAMEGVNEWDVLTASATARFNYEGAWIEFDHIPNMRFGNELVAPERISNDAINFKVPVVSGFEQWPGVVLHMAIEARRLEDGTIKTTGIEQVSAQSYTHTPSGYGSVVVARTRNFNFYTGETGAWEYYAVPVMMLFSDPLDYHYEDGSGNRLCQDKAASIVGMSTYTPGMAGKYFGRQLVVFRSDVKAKLVGVGLAVNWKTSGEVAQALYSATAVVTNPLAIPMTAFVAQKYSQSSIACLPDGLATRQVKRQTIDSATVHLQETIHYPSFQHDAYLTSSEWSASSQPPNKPVFTIEADTSDVPISYPAVLGQWSDTVTISTPLGGTQVIAKFVSEPLWSPGATMQVYFYSTDYQNHFTINVPIDHVLQNVYELDSDGIIEFAAAACFGIDAGATNSALLHMSSSSACEAVLNAYITANWGAHGGIYTAQLHCGSPVGYASDKLKVSGDTFKAKVVA